jgi:putative CocE/NonD family hydrolase
LNITQHVDLDLNDVELPGVSSVYVPMRDGVRLAADVWAPCGTGRRPTVVLFTRYWRSSTVPSIVAEPTGDAIKYFTGREYAFVVVDVRGTGASFGQRATEWSPEEVEDYGEVIDWIAQQEWSNGAVATLGTSYPGNAAELAVLSGSTALRAVVPRFSDFTEYLHAFRPGGVANRVLTETWILLTQTLDSNNAVPRTELVDHLPAGASVRPVDEDHDGTLLAAAVREHANSGDTRAIMDSLQFSDDPFAVLDESITLESVSPSTLWRSIDRKNVPSMHWASWYDGGTADGVLTRYLNYQSPMRLVIGAWNHGATLNANPYGTRGTSVAEPPPVNQYAAVEQFLRPLMGDQPGRHDDRLIEYLTLGVDEWRTTHVWPPAGSALRPYYLTAGHSLSDLAPQTDDGADVYVVNDDASTGPCNRWQTQLGGPLDYGDRRDRDRLVLCYDGAELAEPIELTGSPVANIYLAVDDIDAVLFAYLEEVAPDGTVTLLSEAVQRLSLHDSRRTDTIHLGPVPTFARETYQSLQPGQSFLAALTLSPLSVVIPARHRLRFAIAGADRDTFTRIGTTHRPQTFTIQRSAAQPSQLLLPVVTSGLALGERPTTG